MMTRPESLQPSLLQQAISGFKGVVSRGEGHVPNPELFAQLLASRETVVIG